MRRTERGVDGFHLWRGHVIAAAPDGLELGENVRVAPPDRDGRIAGTARRARLDGLALALHSDVRVAPSRLLASVPEEIADRTEVGAGVEHVHGGRMPEDVRVDALAG
jgi:hypothetical protein